MDQNLKSPKITVLMPVYNGEKFLRESIESVLNQTFTDFELLIINDGSKDGSVQVIKSYDDPRIVFIDNAINQGVIKTLNLGLTKATGKYIAKMDQDDISYPHRLATQYEYLEKHPEIALVGSWAGVFSTNSNKIRTRQTPINPSVIKFELLFGNFMFHPSIFFRKDDIMSVGGYSKEFLAEDYGLYSLLVDKFKIANIPEVLIKYRHHGQSLTAISKTQTIIHQDTEVLVERLISKYLSLNENDKLLISKIIIARHPNSFMTFANTKDSLRLLKKIFKSYIHVENLTKTKINEIKPWYLKRVRLILTKYLISLYHRLIGKNDE